MGSNDHTLPIIDLEKAKTDPDTYAKRIVQALENEGFLYVEGADVDFNQLREACKWFFGLPDEQKLSVGRRPYKPDSDNYYRGYFPVVKGEASRKEAFEACPEHSKKDDPRISKANWMYETTPWPPEDEKFPFKQFMLDYYRKLNDTAMQLLRLVAKGIGIQEDAFESTFEKLPLTTVRLIHYPSWEGSGETPPPNAYSEDGRLITTPDHADTPFLTLLHTFDYAGLELMDAEGKWQPVPPRTNGLVMNIGDTFSRMMGGRFKSTRHRVMDINKDRFSVPFFLEPCFYSDCGVNWVKKFTDTQYKHKEEPYGPWMIHIMKHVKKFAEARFLPEFDYNLDQSPIRFGHEKQPPMAESGSWVYAK